MSTHKTHNSESCTMYQPSPEACSLLYKKRSKSAQFKLNQLELNLCLLPAPSVRLNKISSMVPDEPDLLRHVTQLDVRDNRLTNLDASIFPRLEVLHCERNRIVSLRAKGCLLKSIYASNNGGFLARGTSCFRCRQSCVVRKIPNNTWSHEQIPSPHISTTSLVAKLKSLMWNLFWTCAIYFTWFHFIPCSSLNAFIFLINETLSLFFSIIPF